jgi:hypothetical protein
MMQGLLSARDVSTTTPSYTHEELVAGYFARARSSLVSGLGGLGLPLIYSGVLFADLGNVGVPNLDGGLRQKTVFALMLVGLVIALVPVFLRGNPKASTLKGLSDLPIRQRIGSFCLWALPIIFLMGIFVWYVATGVKSSDILFGSMALLLGLSSIGTLLTALFEYDQAIAFALNKPPNLP